MSNDLYGIQTTGVEYNVTTGAIAYTFDALQVPEGEKRADRIQIRGLDLDGIGSSGCDRIEVLQLTNTETGKVREIAINSQEDQKLVANLERRIKYLFPHSSENPRGSNYLFREAQQAKRYFRTFFFDGKVTPRGRLSGQLPGIDFSNNTEETIEVIDSDRDGITDKVSWHVVHGRLNRGIQFTISRDPEATEHQGHDIFKRALQAFYGLCYPQSKVVQLSSIDHIAWSTVNRYGQRNGINDPRNFAFDLDQDGAAELVYDNSKGLNNQTLYRSPGANEVKVRGLTGPTDSENTPQENPHQVNKKKITAANQDAHQRLATALEQMQAILSSTDPIKPSTFYHWPRRSGIGDGDYHFNLPDGKTHVRVCLDPDGEINFILLQHQNASTANYNRQNIDQRDYQNPAAKAYVDLRIEYTGGEAAAELTEDERKALEAIAEKIVELESK